MPRGKNPYEGKIFFSVDDGKTICKDNDLISKIIQKCFVGAYVETFGDEILRTCRGVDANESRI